MGNLQNKEGNGGTSGPTLNVPAGNFLDAIARASTEAARIRREHEKKASVSFDSDDDDFDSDLEDEERSVQKNAGSSNKKGCAEPSDLKRPWLISSRASIECEKAQITIIKEKCKANYPGMSSTYIDKIKWAEGNFRSLEEKTFTGNALRDIVYEEAPDDIFVQVLIRKRVLKSILCTNEGMAQAFFKLFTDPSEIIVSNEAKKDKDNDDKKSEEKCGENSLDIRNELPTFFLRSNALDSVQDKTKKANQRMKRYIDWIMEEEDSGTVLSPNKNKKQSPLTCFFTIKAKKNALLTRDIIDPVSSIVKVLPEHKIMHIGPSPLPPQFVTTLLHTDSETKVGCLPHFPSTNNTNSIDKNDPERKKEIMCAAIEIIVGLKTNPSSIEDKKTESGSHLSAENIYHKERIYAELIQLKRKSKGKTFHIVNIKEIEKNMNSIMPLSLSKDFSLPDGDNFPVIWISSYFDLCFPRVYAHYNFGKGESLEIQTEVNSQKLSPPPPKGSAVYDCKFDILESNLSAIIENRCHLSLADQLCYVLAFTMVIFMDSACWMTQMRETNEVFNNFGELFDDLGTFWKSLLKNRDEDIGLGLSNDSNHVTAGGSGSRKALLQLIFHMQSKIQNAYGHLLEENQAIDFGALDDTTDKKTSNTSSPKVTRKRIREADEKNQQIR